MAVSIKKIINSITNFFKGLLNKEKPKETINEEDMSGNQWMKPIQEEQEFQGHLPESEPNNYPEIEETFEAEDEEPIPYGNAGYLPHNELRLSAKGEKLIKHFESLRLTAYADSGGIYTIGWGNIHYENGAKVKKGDKITQAKAEELFWFAVRQKENIIKGKVKRRLLQHEFDAAVSFCFNAGTGYKKNNKYVDYNIWTNINNKLSGEAMKTYWRNLAITAGGKKLAGLIRRRKAEVHLYQTGEVNFFQ